MSTGEAENWIVEVDLLNVGRECNRLSKHVLRRHPGELPHNPPGFPYLSYRSKRHMFTCLKHVITARSDGTTEGTTAVILANIVKLFLIHY